MTEERAARFNQGKAPVQYLPLFLVADSLRAVPLETPERQIALQLIDHLSQFQRSGDITAINDGIRLLAEAGKWTECAEALEFGAKKYSAWNWTKGSDWTVPMSSAVRHAFKLILKKELIDDESNCSHLGHMMCNFVFIRIFFESYPEGNDLPPKNFNIPVLEQPVESTESVPSEDAYGQLIMHTYRSLNNIYVKAQEYNDAVLEDNIIDLLDAIWFKAPATIRDILNKDKY